MRAPQPRALRNATSSRSDAPISALPSLPISATRLKLGFATEGIGWRVYNESHARPARPDPAQDLDRALHCRRSAGRLADALEVLRARSLAGDDPQRDGGSRRARLHREPPYFRGPRADAARLPLLRRYAARHQAAGVAAAPAHGRRAPSRQPAP